MVEERKRQARGAQPGLVQGAWVASSVTGARLSPRRHTSAFTSPRRLTHVSDVRIKSRSPPGYRARRRGD
jgi:hypothetical protein